MGAGGTPEVGLDGEEDGRGVVCGGGVESGFTAAVDVDPLSTTPAITGALTGAFRRSNAPIWLSPASSPLKAARNPVPAVNTPGIERHHPCFCCSSAMPWSCAR